MNRCHILVRIQDTLINPKNILKASIGQDSILPKTPYRIKISYNCMAGWINTGGLERFGPETDEFHYSTRRKCIKDWKTLMCKWEN